ncbi:MAG: class I SAM-dependent methyltransferase [Acidobacteria bacterium]|nr:class I SAM-dependent methyltransferase [Acidobacteriota bacterium]
MHLHTYWLGVQVLKCPLDLWIYQEIIAELQPDVIIETGTYKGGSAWFMAHILDLIGKGEIFTIDVADDLARPAHPRIHYVKGSSTDEQLLHTLMNPRPTDETRLIILDSLHTKAHVLKELHLWSPFVSPNSYLIVEDTNINGHPTYPTFGAGPYEAVEEFFKMNSDFMVDTSREKFLMTFNPRGFLKRLP